MQRPAVDGGRTGPGDASPTSPSILCPVDFSHESLVTLARAVEIARRSGARLVAVHVVDSLLAQAAAATYHNAVAIDESEHALRDAIDHVCWETGAGRLRVAARILVGDTATAICEFCRQHAVDLIVVGSHASGGYRHRVFGSVCETLLRTAPAPVLVFPAHASRLASVCVVDRLNDPTSTHTGQPQRRHG